MTHRTFIAINLPEKIKNKLGELIAELKRKNKQQMIKWVDSNILHLTLHFLGNLTDEQIEVVKRILNERVGESEVVNLELGLVGAFPNLQEPRVIFVEAKEKSGRLIKLVKTIGDDLLNQGFEIDSRTWQSHITLGRVKGRINELEGIDHQFEDGVSWQVESVDLMESGLDSEGPRYKVTGKYEVRKGSDK